MFEVPERPSQSAPPTEKAELPFQAAPGEFTQMFQSPAMERKETSEPLPATPAASPAPGEFTQLFLAQKPDAPLPTAIEPKRTQEPGEFTRLFQVPDLGATATRQNKAWGVPDVSVPNSAPPPAQTAKATLAAPAQTSGEFTQMFQAPTATAKPADKESHQPGEFTSLFQTAVPSTQSVTVPASPPPSPAPSSPVAKQPDPEATLLFPSAPPVPQKPQPPSSGPGEFTQMFARPQSPANSPSSSSAAFDALFNQSPTQEAFPSNPPAPAANSQPGEFTRMLESPLARSGLKPQAPVAAPQERFSMKGSSSGFTQMLESPVSSHSEAPSMPAPSRQDKPSGEATRAFRFPEPPPTPPPAAAPPPQTGPSEFTQMFKAPAKKEEPKPEKPAAKPARVTPRRKPNRAYLTWILAASGILLIIAIIVFFAVRD